MKRPLLPSPAPAQQLDASAMFIDGIHLFAGRA
jgi:hypothetical protein